jgi:hypothetical protein
MQKVFGDAEVRLVVTREIKPAPSQVPSQRLMEAPQESVGTRPAPGAGATEPPAASERVTWWRRIFGP